MNRSISLLPCVARVAGAGVVWACAKGDAATMRAAEKRALQRSPRVRRGLESAMMQRPGQAGLLILGP